MGVVQATLTGIETVTGNFSAGGTLSMLSSTGVTTVESGGSTNAAIFASVGSAATALRASNTGFGTTFGFTNAALTGSTDTVALTLNNMTAGTVTVQPTTGTNGAETIAITSSGSSNTATLDDGTSTSLVTLTIAGTQDLALTVTPTTVTTINAASLTGALTHTTTGADTLVFGTSADGTGYTAPTTLTISGFEALTFTNAIAAGLTTATVQAGIARWHIHFELGR